MPRPLSVLSRFALVTAIGGVAAAAAVGPAHAQIPGLTPADDAAQYIVVTGDSRIKLSVSTPDVTAGVVKVTVQNDTAGTLTCSGFGEGGTLTVLEARTAVRAVQHYKNFAVAPDPKVDVTGVPTQGTITINLGSVTGLLPAALANLIWPEIGSRAVIAGEYDAARLQGRVGRYTPSVSVGARSSTTVTVPLGRPSNGTRTTFDAGAVLGCAIGGVNYVFAGYSPGTPDQTSGSLELPFFGRFGS